MKKFAVIVSLVIAVGVGLAMMQVCKKGPSKLTEDQIEEVWTQDASKTVITPSAYEELKELYEASGDPEKSDDFDEYLSNFLTETYPGQTIEVQRPGPAVNLPLKAVVYIDNTASMKGYLNPVNPNVSVTDFVNVVNALNDYFSDKETDGMFVSQNGLQEMALPELVTSLKGKKFKTYDAYPMNEFIESIVAESLADSAYNRVNFFITDAIPSGTNKEISQDPHFNKNSASVLETNIKSALRSKNLKEKGYGVSVYQFNGKFDGPYINYTNNKVGKPVTLKDAPRPFYVVAIGNAQQLKDFGSKAVGGELRDFKPINSLQAYTPVTALSPTLVVPGSEQGTITSEDGVFTFTSDKSHPSMTVNLPLNQLPEYLRTQDDVNRVLVVKINGKDIFKDNPGQIKVSGETITFPLNFTGDDKTMTMELSVRNDLPLWVENNTSHDDINIASADQICRTFNLDVVVRGLLDGVFNRKTQTLGVPATYTITYE